MRVELRPFQKDTVKQMHNGCVLYGDVGGGKTITSLGYYFQEVCGGTINEWGSMETPRDLIVITTAKVRDSKSFEAQAAQFGVHEDPSLSTNGVKITVDSWNNLHKYVEVQDAFFIFDEQRVVGYGAWSRAFIKVAKSNQWVLLSATPGDTWLDYIPVFIANGWYKHKTDFTDQHVVWTPRVKYPKVLRYQNVGKLVRQRNQVLVHMPFERHTKRHPVDIWCEYDEELFDKVVKKRWHVFEKRPLRDVAELFIVMRKVVNSDASRLMAVQNLLEKHPRLIVFYNFDYELEMLRTLQPSSHSQPDSSPLSEVGQSRSARQRSTATARTDGSNLDEAIQPLEKLTSPSEPSNGSSQQTTGSKSDSSSRTESRFQESTLPSSSTPASPKSKSSSSTRKSSSTSSQGSSTSSSQHGSVSGSPSTFEIAEWNGHKHEELPTSDRWLYLVQYRAGAEGWNCISTDAICFYSQTYSYRDWFQAHGRIDRLNTPFTDLWYYHLVSRSVIDKAIRAALKVKKSFNEKDLVLK